MLNELSNDITNHYWRMPPIKGVIAQLGTYNWETDKKVPQDTVMTLAELSYLARFIPVDAVKSASQAKNNYRDRKQRTTVRRRR
jgi:hypothetical protein